MVLSSAVLQGHDLVLDGLPLTIARQRGRRLIRYETTPTEADDPVYRKDVPALDQDFSGGGGYSTAVDGVNGYAYALRATGRWGRALVPGPEVVQVALPSLAGIANMDITDSWVYPDKSDNANIYFLCERYCLRLPDGNPPFQLERDFGANNNAEGAIVFNQDAYVGFHQGTFQKRTAGGTWSTASFNRRKLGKVFWTAPTALGGMRPSYRLLSTNDSGFKYYHVDLDSDPMVAANWAGPFFLGDGSFRAKSIVASNRHAYFITTGGVFDLDETGRTPNLTPYHEDSGDARNGSCGLYHEGFVYAGHAYGLDRVDVSTTARQDIPQWVQPGAPPQNYEGPLGRPTALCADQGWVVAAFHVESSNEAHIWWGRDRRSMGIPGVGHMLWHGPEIVLPGYVTHMRIATRGGSTPRLYIATYESGEFQAAPGRGVLFFVAILEPGRGPIRGLQEGSGYRWQTGLVDPVQVYLSRRDWGDAAATKTLLAHEIQADHLAEGQQEVELSSAADTGAFVPQGVATESPEQQIIPSEWVRGHRIGSRLDLRGTATRPPIVRAYKQRASVKARAREVRTYRVVFGPVRPRLGPYDRDGRADWESLKARELAGPIYLDPDEWGQRVLVNCEQVVPLEETEDQATGEAVRMAELTVTVLPEPS